MTGKGSLRVEIMNGPAVVVCGTGLTTEQAVEEVCGYLPVRPVAITDEMVERAARAMWIKDYAGYLGHEPPEAGWPDIEDPEHYRAAARAALTAAFQESLRGEESNVDAD